jgi:hypothetical protein
VINVESTSEGVPRFGLRVALGAVTLALGWLVVGAISGGDSASAADSPPLAPDAPSAAVYEHTSGLAATVTATVATTVHAAPVAADELLATQPAVVAVAGPSPIQDVTAPVIRVATDALDHVADAVDLTAITGLLPELPALPGAVHDAAPAVDILGAEVGSAVLPTPESPTLTVSPSNASSAPSAPSDTTIVTASEPPPAQPSTPTTPTEALVPTAPASFAAECDLSRSRWDVPDSGGAVLPPGNDDLPSHPAFDFDPTPD